MTTDGQVQETNASTETAPKPQATKVFVGNLSFKTRTKSLRDAFSKYGTVEGARVVTQGRRSLGYGFVQFATVEEAKNAVEQLHHTELEERKINVEISTSLNSKVNPKKKPQRKQRRRRITSGSDQNASPKTTPVTIDVNPVDGAPIKKKRPPFKKSTNSKSEPKEPSDVAVTEGNTTTSTSKVPKRRKKPNNKPKYQRRNRERVDPSTREYSTTVIYVSNIPYKLEDEDLKNAFQDHNAISANVIRRKNNNLSKGFGFVTLDNPENQAAAVDEKNGTKLLDRTIIVKKAHLRPEKPENPSGTPTEALPNKTE